MRFLGIDFGTKNIGLATSDENGIFAFPKGTLKNEKDIYEKIKKVIEEENISKIIIGKSLNLNNQGNKIEKEIEIFVRNLKLKCKLPIEREKEFFTSFEAHKRQGKERNNARKMKIEKTKELDAKSATIILQRYLDRNNNIIKNKKTK